MTIATALKRFRTEFNLPKKEVAEKLGVSASSYYRYESGRFSPEAEIIVTLAKEYGVSADYLLGLSDVPRPIGVEETEVRKARTFFQRLKEFVAAEETRAVANA